MGALTIAGVHKAFHGTPVLQGIDLAVEAGEFLILVGPSGCGKSTLLNIIAGLDAPTAGTVAIGDRDVTDLAPKDRDIAMVFQSYALYPNMTVAQNIAFGLEMRGVPRAQRDAQVARVASMLQIEPLLARKPAQLSGGQRQRVAMGRALAREPRLFLFDEPLSNLDAKLRVEMRAEIKLLHQRTRTTTVYVTHDQVEAMTLGDRIAVMRAGRVEQFGTPEDIYARPATRFVAEFIGSPAMNLVDLDAARRAALGVLAPVGGDVAAMGLRPEALRIDADDFVNGNGEGDRALPGAIRLIEPTGPDTYATVDTAAGAWVVRVPGLLHARVGDAVRVRWDPAAVHLFDVAGARISP